VWVSTTTPSGAYQVGRRGWVQATFLTGYDGTRNIYDQYRKGWREAGHTGDVPVNRLAYAALVYCADNEKRAREGAEKLLWYMTANKVSPQFQYPPGYMPVPAMASVMRGTALDQHAANRGNATVDKAIEAGLMFAGTPDQVYAQIKKMYDHVGGFGHVLNMGQAGFLEHDDTVHGIKMFAREVYPRLKAEFPDMAVSGNYVKAA
jgi:alkanesulfonate monooxygenase SsuD/methylene tetrahydromethanopterin reductase-like flavin-dependent oxidoreductase (luciferase family)